MIKKIVLGVLLAAGVIAALFVFTGLNNGGEDIKPELIQSNPTQQSQAPEPTAAVPGAYKEYDERVAVATEGTKLLFFHAPWCPQCRSLDTSIKNGTVPENVTIFKVDYDSNQALRKKYGVTIQTTIVKVDDLGNFVKKYVAYDEPTLESVIKNAL